MRCGHTAGVVNCSLCLGNLSEGVLASSPGLTNRRPVTPEVAEAEEEVTVDTPCRDESTSDVAVELETTADALLALGSQEHPLDLSGHTRVDVSTIESDDSNADWKGYYEEPFIQGRTAGLVSVTDAGMLETLTRMIDEVNPGFGINLGMEPSTAWYNQPEVVKLVEAGLPDDVILEQSCITLGNVRARLPYYFQGMATPITTDVGVDSSSHRVPIISVDVPARGFAERREVNEVRVIEPADVSLEADTFMSSIDSSTRVPPMNIFDQYSAEPADDGTADEGEDDEDVAGADEEEVELVGSEVTPAGMSAAQGSDQPPPADVVVVADTLVPGPSFEHPAVQPQGSTLVSPAVPSVSTAGVAPEGGEVREVFTVEDSPRMIPASSGPGWEIEACEARPRRAEPLVVPATIDVWMVSDRSGSESEDMALPPAPVYRVKTRGTVEAAADLAAKRARNAVIKQKKLERQTRREAQEIEIAADIKEEPERTYSKGSGLYRYPTG
jgi:hypothetical protein